MQDQYDVIVMGSGIAGMAVTIHLRRAGMTVLCIEETPGERNPVGESLDWSAPGLLETLGLPMDALLEQGIATLKRHVILRLRDASQHEYVPGDWLARPPYNVQLDTVHVDRTRLDQTLRGLFLASGVECLNGRVVRVESDRYRVMGLETAGGERYRARWYVDASGSAASVLPRHFRSPAVEFGPQKVAIWDYFFTDEQVAGTTLNADTTATGYMEWVWQIPVQAESVSVGYVALASTIKEKRRAGMTLAQIFTEQMARFPALRSLEISDRQPSTRSFRCRAYRRITGPNWLAIGEAAAMVDPMTSNGVTAAMRQAAEAAAILVSSRDRQQLHPIAAWAYGWRTYSLASFFNRGIETLLYERVVRGRLGPFIAGDAYTIPAWSTNLLYTRLQPRGLLASLLFGLVLRAANAGLSVVRWCFALGDSEERQSAATA